MEIQTENVATIFLLNFLVQIFYFTTAIISNENNFCKETISLKHWMKAQNTI